MSIIRQLLWTTLFFLCPMAYLGMNNPSDLNANLTKNNRSGFETLINEYTITEIETNEEFRVTKRTKKSTPSKDPSQDPSQSQYKSQFQDPSESQDTNEIKENDNKNDYKYEDEFFKFWIPFYTPYKTSYKDQDEDQDQDYNKQQLFNRADWKKWQEEQNKNQGQNNDEHYLNTENFIKFQEKKKKNKNKNNDQRYFNRQNWKQFKEENNEKDDISSTINFPTEKPTFINTAKSKINEQLDEDLLLKKEDSVKLEEDQLNIQQNLDDLISAENFDESPKDTQDPLIGEDQEIIQEEDQESMDEEGSELDSQDAEENIKFLQKKEFD